MREQKCAIRNAPHRTHHAATLSCYSRPHSSQSWHTDIPREWAWSRRPDLTQRQRRLKRRSKSGLTCTAKPSSPAVLGPRPQLRAQPRPAVTDRTGERGAGPVLDHPRPAPANIGGPAAGNATDLSNNVAAQPIPDPFTASVLTVTVTVTVRGRTHRFRPGATVVGNWLSCATRSGQTAGPIIRRAPRR